jgi:hypothetical protein
VASGGELLEAVCEVHDGGDASLNEISLWRLLNKRKQLWKDE